MDISENGEKPLGVAVITTSGTFPNDDDYRRASEGEKIETILKAAADKLGLTNTGDWIALVDEREINPNKTFKEESLHCVVDIEWHKREGGGGS
jgi:hypothetical protein